MNHPKKDKYKKEWKTSEEGIKTTAITKISDDKVLFREMYRDSIPVGVWISTDYKGELLHRDFDKIPYYIKPPRESMAENQGEKSDFVLAQYGESLNDLYNFLGKNVHYPEEAKEAGIQGKVYVMLRIDTEGSVHIYSIMRSAHPVLDFEAARVVSIMPDWYPATKNGIAVESHYVLPVQFTLR